MAPLLLSLLPKKEPGCFEKWDIASNGFQIPQKFIRKQCIVKARGGVGVWEGWEVGNVCFCRIFNFAHIELLWCIFSPARWFLKFSDQQVPFKPSPTHFQECDKHKIKGSLYRTRSLQTHFFFYQPHSVASSFNIYRQKEEFPSVFCGQICPLLNPLMCVTWNNTSNVRVFRLLQLLL